MTGPRLYELAGEAFDAVVLIVIALVLVTALIIWFAERYGRVFRK